MGRYFRHSIILILTIIVWTLNLGAQQINFSTFAGSGITLTANPDVLSFNSVSGPILRNTGETISVTLAVGEPAVIAISGQADLDVTVTIDAPDYLVLDGGTDQIGVAIQFAYSNQGSANASAAKLVAVEIPGTFNTATFPLKRRTSGTRAIPPTPRHSGYTPPTTTAYLFIYGSLGPVGDVGAGSYLGVINVTVEYSTYD